MTRVGRIALVAAALAAGTAAVALVGFDVQGPLRTMLVLGFLLTGPGTVLVVGLRVDELPSAAALVVPLSLTVDAIAAGVVLYLGGWSPSLILGLVVAASFGVGVWALARETRSVPDADSYSIG